MVSGTLIKEVVCLSRYASQRNAKLFVLFLSGTLPQCWWCVCHVCTVMSSHALLSFVIPFTHLCKKLTPLSCCWCCPQSHPSQRPLSPPCPPSLSFSNPQSELSHLSIFRLHPAFLTPFIIFFLSFYSRPFSKSFENIAFLPSSSALSPPF